MHIIKHCFPLFFFFVLFIGAPVFAVDPKPTVRDSGFAAQYMGQSIADPIELMAGETKIITVRFKNVGTQSWNSLNQHPNGYRHVSAYTVEPRYRASAFAGASWLGNTQTGSILKDTKPGEIAELAITLTAPNSPGMYTEELYLAAENYSWVKGGYFFLKIKVVPKTQSPQPSPNNTDAAPGAPPAGSSGGQTPSSPAASEPAAQTSGVHVVFRSRSVVEGIGGERIKMLVRYKNIGSAPWQSYQVLSLATPDVAISDAAWETQSVILTQTNPVAQASTTREIFYFRLPQKKGTYTATFDLKTDGIVQEAGRITVSLNVTQDAPASYTPPSPKKDETPVVAPRLSEEPRIRVGLWHVETDPVKLVEFQSADDDYIVYKGIEPAGELLKNTKAQMQYIGGVSMFSAGDLFFQTNKYIRLEPKNNPSAVFELPNYSRLVSWKGPKNFNRYRGVMEYRMGEKSNNFYVVNELLFEDYVKGIAENSNGAPAEYLKSQTVAQRSYAYAIMHQDKYGIFDVVATTGDQLYLGVGSEELTPNFVAAALATRGMMATYDLDANPATQSDVVVTPYFANAGCSTKSWAAVWGGQKPWLVPVKTTYDCARGRAQFGHGVGMSQLDASERAQKEGLDWKALVQYYYTGVGLELMYQ